MYTLITTLLFSILASPLLAQNYQQLPEDTRIYIEGTPLDNVKIINTLTNEFLKLAPGNYISKKNIDSTNGILENKFSIDKDHYIDGIITYDLDTYKMVMYIKKSFISQLETYVNKKLFEKQFITAFKDSVLYTQNFTTDNRLLAEHKIYFNTKDSGKSHTTRYYENGQLQYTDDEISGIIKEYNEDGIIQKITETNPIKPNEVTTKFFKDGKITRLVKGANYLMPDYKEQYDANGKVEWKEYAEHNTNIKAYYYDGILQTKEQWMLNDSKSIIENYKNGKLDTKEITTDRYDAVNRVIEIFDNKGILLQRRVAAKKNGFIYYRTYDDKGKLIKQEKATLLQEGFKSTEKSTPPQ